MPYLPHRVVHRRCRSYPPQAQPQTSLLAVIPLLFTELPRRLTFPETEGMYVYTALNKGGSAIYHGYKSSLVPFSENLWGDRWGKGKEELGTRLFNISC